MRWQKLLIGLSVLAAMSASAFAEPSPKMLKSMARLNRSLFVDGKINEDARPRPEAAQRKVLDAIFPKLTSSNEKLAFLAIMFQDFRLATQLPILGEYVAKLINDTDAAVRKNAVQILAVYKMRQFGDAVLPLLDDSDREVRMASIQALGLMGRHDLVPRMAHIAKSAETQPERETSLSIIGLLLHDSTATVAQHDAELAIIATYLDDQASSQMRVVALERLMRLHDADKYLNLVLKLMANSDSGTRIAAVNVLAFISGDSVTKALLTGLKDSEPEVRVAAAEALASLDRWFVRPENLRPPTLKAAAEIALLLDDGSPDVRVVALRSLDVMHATDYAEAIAKRMDDPDEDVREWAILTLASMKVVKFANAVAVHLNDEEEDVRCEALKALGVMGAREHTPAIVARASDKSSEVRKNVIRALQTLEARDQRTVIKKLSRDKDVSVASEAKDLLAAWDKKVTP